MLGSSFQEKQHVVGKVSVEIKGLRWKLFTSDNVVIGKSRAEKWAYVNLF